MSKKHRLDKTHPANQRLQEHFMKMERRKAVREKEVPTKVLLGSGKYIPAGLNKNV